MSYVRVCVATTTVRMMVLMMMIMLLLYVYDGPSCCHGFTTQSSLPSPSTLTVTVTRRSSSATKASTTATTARTRPGSWMIIGVSSTKESGLKMSSSGGGGGGDNKISVDPRQFVQLTNPLDGMMLEDDDNIIGGEGGGTGRRSDNDNVALSSVGSKLPASFITSWSTFVLETDGTWYKIPDATSTVSSAIRGEFDNKNSSSEASIEEQLPTGHVNPSSIDELWSPIDLKRPQMRLALAAHVRQGVIRHIMPAVDVGYLSSSNSNDGDGDDNNSGTKSSSVVTYRNRGMCSVPRSHTWMEFLGRYGRFKLIASMKRNGQNINKYDDDDEDEDGDRQEEEGKEEWTTILQSSPTGQDISDAIERVTVALADENVPTELGDGSHIVNIILTGDDTTAEQGNDIGEKFVEIPKAGHELRVSMVAVKDSSSKNSNSDIGSSQKMIETTEDRKIKEQCREVARLQVQISSTMPGSESQYLPEVYKELYNDQSLRNPLYDKFKSRKQEKQQQQQQQQQS